MIVYRVIPPHGIPWIPHYKTEEAAWGRIVATKSRHGRRPDATFRTALEFEGWKVKPLEVGSRP